MKEIWIYDEENWENFHSNTFLNPNTGEIQQFYIHSTKNQLKEYIEFIFTRVSGLIGFNNVIYDYPILHFIILNRDRLLNLTVLEVCAELYRESQNAISSTYSSIKANEILIPQLDLRLIHHFNNKNKMTSLKYIEINTKFHNVEDLPFDPDYWVQKKDIPKIMRYNINDVKATATLYDISKKAIDMRRELRRQFGFPIGFMNYNDPKIGEEIFAKEIAKELSVSVWDLKKSGGTPRTVINLKDIILPNIKFSTREFNKVLEQFKNTTIYDTQNPFEYNVIYKGFKYDYGVGGIHGCIKSGIYTSDEEYEIIDIDIDGMYPSTSILNGFFPEHLGKGFCTVYERLYKTRIKAKRQSKLDKTDMNAFAINAGLKLALNGVYGKSNDRYSFLYDPRFTMQITVNGQLLLSMLAERIANIENLTVLQANTDGITVRLNRKDTTEFNRICTQWEQETGYSLEHANYKKMVIRDVNNYLAVYNEGYTKLKGTFEIDKDLHKNHSQKIVPIALREYYVNNTPISETIRNHKDIFDFCIAKKFPKPWHGEYTELVNQQKIKTIYKKTIRYYISNTGSYLWKVNGEDGRQSQLNVGYAVRPFNKYEEKQDYNINYNFYIAEANKIINTIDDGQMTFSWY